MYQDQHREARDVCESEVGRVLDGEEEVGRRHRVASTWSWGDDKMDVDAYDSDDDE